ncbi:MAG: rhomboid family intramembrane serine protease [Candidatus Eisenbacteria bacterium]
MTEIPRVPLEPEAPTGLDDEPGFLPPDPNEQPPVELSSAVGDVVPWGTVLVLLSWGVVSFALAASRELGESSALIARGASVTQPLSFDAAWRLIGSTFLHSGASHLFFNAITLLVLGQAVERIFSRWGFWILVAWGGALASLGSLAWRLARHPGVMGLSIGGSGVVFALGGALLAGAFRLRDRLAPTRARALAATVLFLTLPGFAAGFERHGTDNMAHAAGLVAGLCIGVALPLNTRLAGRPAGNSVRLLGAAAVIALAAVFARVLRG